MYKLVYKFSQLFRLHFDTQSATKPMKSLHCVNFKCTNCIMYIVHNENFKWFVDNEPYNLARQRYKIEFKLSITLFYKLVGGVFVLIETLHYTCPWRRRRTSCYTNSENIHIEIKRSFRKCQIKYFPHLIELISKDVQIRCATQIKCTAGK